MLQRRHDSDVTVFDGYCGAGGSGCSSPEVKRGMAFPGEYILLGNKREQVRMAGNAVTPNAARDLIAACVESLGYTVRRHYDLVA